MSFKIRKASIEDAYESSLCHIAAWQSAYKGIISDEYLDNMPTSLKQRVESFKDYQFDNFYLPTYEGKIIGKLILWDSRDEDKPGTGEIGAIYLLEEFWGKGYGYTMMNFAIRQLIGRGCTEVFLWVFEENTRARLFYEKCGFVLDGAKKEVVIGTPLMEVRYVFKSVK